MFTSEPFSFNELLSIQDFELRKPSFLQMSDGIKIAYYNFSRSTDKNIAILYTGAGLYGNKSYQWVAKTLQEKYSIGCYIFDIRGHGHSEGKRGDAPSFNIVIQDVQEAVYFVKKSHPDANIYLAGHSAGAGLIINYAANTKDKLENGYIFLAPFLGPKSGTDKNPLGTKNSFVKKIRNWVYFLGFIFPNSFIKHFKAIFFNYPEYILKSDPLILSSYSYVMSCATTPYEIKDLLTKIDRSTGIYIGKEDEQFQPERVIAYKDLIKSRTIAEIIPDAGHLSILLKAPDLIASFINHKN